MLHPIRRGPLPGKIDKALGSQGIVDARFVQSFDFIEFHDAVLVFHEFSEEVHDFKQTQIFLIGDHEIVANLAVFSDARGVGVVQDEELASVSLHEFYKLQSLIFFYDDQLAEMFKGLLFGLEHPINNRDCTARQLRISIVGELNHLVTDRGLNDRLDRLFGGQTGEEAFDETMIALYFEHRAVGKHGFQVELLGRHFERFKLSCDPLDHDVVVDISDEFDNIEALNLTVDHHLIFFRLDQSISIVDPLALLHDLQHMVQNLLYPLLIVPKA